MSVTLTNHQYAAVKDAAEWFADARRHDWGTGGYGRNIHEGQAFTLTGYAGSGKTTCVPTLVEEMGLDPDNVGFMAPTGKAAKVLSGKLQAGGLNRNATTIHSAIYTPKSVRADYLQERIDALEAHIQWRETENFNDEYAHRLPEDNPGYDMSDAECEQKMRQLDLDLDDAIAELNDRDGPSFTRKHKMQLPPGMQLFVVDEASMVDEELATDLSTFGIPILALGDPGQLPPVKGSWGFDMEDPDVFLEEIHRQAQDNPIIQLATMARQGQDIKLGNYGDGVEVVSRRNDNVTYDVDRLAMILVGTHKARWRITKKIREALGITETGPIEGEPLLVCRNSRKHADLVNGSILECLTEIGDLENGNARLVMDVLDPETGFEYEVEATQALFEEHVFRQRNSYSAEPKEAFRAKKSCEHLDFGHVLTVHKAQGSEWDNVVLHNESGMFRDQADRWLYTGITRAAKELTIVEPR